MCVYVFIYAVCVLHKYDLKGANYFEITFSRQQDLTVHTGARNIFLT